MNKTAIAIVSGLIGAALAAGIVIAVTSSPNNQNPTKLPDTTAPTVSEATLPDVPATSEVTGSPAEVPEIVVVTDPTEAPETLPASTDTTTAAPAVLPAPAPPATTTAAPAVLPAPAPAPTTPEITKEEAEEIALKHAGLTADDVRFSRTEYDREFGANEWEVEFHQGSTEYSYTINASTGDILEYEIDRNDWD
jgi:uncharacterized membrane protein YkoI